VSDPLLAFDSVPIRARRLRFFHPFP